MRKWMVVGFALLAACSSSTTSEGGDPALGSGHGQCAQRAGSYVVKYTVRTGNCGDAAESVQNIDAQPTEPKAPCTGKIEYTTDNCEVTYSSVCPADFAQKGAKLTISGHSKWSTDATQGTAIESWSAEDVDGKNICQGTYDVTMAKQ